MSIIGTLPNQLTNGTLADASQVMADFNFIVAQVNANAAGSGVNSDITQLTGLTIPLSISQGGTGTNSPSLVGGSNVVISGSWPNQTITVAGIGTGTVTSITAGTGLTGGTITSSGTIALSIPVAISSGGTNATSAAAALTNLGGIGLSVANTFTAAQIISLTTATVNLTLVSTDAGASQGPTLSLDRQSVSPAVNDTIGGVQFQGRSSTNVSRTYARITTAIISPTNAAEDGSLDISTMVAGALVSQMHLDGGMVVGAATGGSKGTGTVNATALYDDNVQLLAATQAEMEAQTAGVGKFVTAATTKFSPGVAKFAASLDGGAGTALSAYNATTARSTTGTYTVTIGTDFSSANWVLGVGYEITSNTISYLVTAKSAGAVTIETRKTGDGSLIDVDILNVFGFGDQ